MKQSRNNKGKFLPKKITKPHTMRLTSAEKEWIERNREREEEEVPKTTRYKEIYEDKVISLQLGEEFLRIYTKLDSSAYDIPLKPILLLIHEELKIRGKFKTNT